MEKIIVAAIFVIFVMILVSKMARVVPQQNAFVVERLGKFSGTLGAGFHFLVPFLDIVRYKHSLKEQAIDIPEQICITRDNVTVGDREALIVNERDVVDEILRDFEALKVALFVADAASFRSSCRTERELPA